MVKKYTLIFADVRKEWGASVAREISKMKHWSEGVLPFSFATYHGDITQL